jgi:uncharacterized protein (TIGR02145 family)
MCHNLGAAPVTATQTLDEIKFEYSGTGTGKDTLSSDAKGWWFQWGRLADGHQWRDNSAAHTIAGPDTVVDYFGSASAKRAGKFITTSDIYSAYDWHYPPCNFLWRNWNDGRFPCPSGWRIPSSDEWGSIYREGGSYGTTAQATVNKWPWKSGTTATGQGILIQPDGTTTTLFLPATGGRGWLDDVPGVGTAGAYWSSTSASSEANYLYFAESMVSPSVQFPRSYGMNVRCLSE